ncbi:MAG TPA: hypothetical protein VFQ61_14640 [Polyangiaceae bacterium]|nr:hypothetical protein [Polyangiaceae bacterium]
MFAESLVGFSPRPAFQVLRREPHALRVRVSRAALEPLCEGHFPGDPIVPGAHLFALASDAGALLSSRRSDSLCTKRIGEVTQNEPVNAQFRQIVRPDHDIEIELCSYPIGALEHGEIRSSIYSVSESDCCARFRCLTRAGSLQRFSCPEPVSERRLNEVSTQHSEGTEQIARLKHRGRALLLERELLVQDEQARLASEGPKQRSFGSRSLDQWHWPLLLDGAAQAAGLIAKDAAGSGTTGLTTSTPSNASESNPTLVVVAYELKHLVRAQYAGRVEFSASFRRRVLAMLELSVVARAPSSGRVLLETNIVLAPKPAR